MEPQLLPIFMKLAERSCLVVGGGEVAARKVAALRKAGANVRVIAPSIGPAIARHLTKPSDVPRANTTCFQADPFGSIEWYRKEIAASDLRNEALVFIATDEPAVNAQVARWCREREIPVNVADSPELCTFFMPAIVDRYPVQVAISTQGASPLLARSVRAQIETLLPANLGSLGRFMQTAKTEVKKTVGEHETRRRLLEQILEGPLSSMVLEGNENEALAALAKTLAGADGSGSQGEVYLVGAGPGDPELLTLKALRYMQRADVVIYDRLVTSEILELVRRDAERIFVGKKRRSHVCEQEEINSLLIEHARLGKRVLRLKGGDPFVFGRGGEEMEALAEAGIPFQVVPGITAALGCAAAARIPLTHREHAQSVTFITGHVVGQDVNWKGLCQQRQTIVVYMGLTNLGTVRQKLLEHGLPGDTPAALIQAGTTRAQKCVVGTVDGLPGLLEVNELTSPVLMIVGEVVRLNGIGQRVGSEGAQDAALLEGAQDAALLEGAQDAEFSVSNAPAEYAGEWR